MSGRGSGCVDLHFLVGRFGSNARNPLCIAVEDALRGIGVPRIAAAAFLFNLGKGGMFHPVASAEEGLAGFEVIETCPKDIARGGETRASPLGLRPERVPPGCPSRHGLQTTPRLP